MLRKLYVTLYRWGIALFGGLGLHKIWPFGKIHDYLSARARGYHTPEALTVFGNTLYLVPGDNMGLSIWGEAYERDTTRIVEKELHPGGVFVDIGANIGFFTLFAAKLVGPGGKVYAFEPDHKNIELLKKNIAANRYHNIVVEEKAAAAAPGVIEFFLSEHNAGDHTMYDRQSELRKLEAAGTVNPQAVYDQHSARDPRTKVSVQAIALDDYFASQPVDVMKIDVQGGEGQVLSGMKNLLAKNRTIKIVSEFWPAGLTLAGTSPEDYLKTFEELGFSFWLIEKHGLVPQTRAELLAAYTVYNNHTAELFMARHNQP